jgi:pimeloyl-ACP methyl ester carboxylesterase
VSAAAEVPPDGLAVDVHNPDATVTVVLVHGAPDRGSTFRPLLPHLNEFRVVVYDRRGYGRSVTATPPGSMVDHARDLLSVVADQTAPCVVVGHSFGSNPAMLAASLEPGAFAALGVWEPPLPWVDWWPNQEYYASVVAAEDPGAVAEDLARRLLGEDQWAVLDQRGRQLRRAEGPAFRTDIASQLTAPFEFTAVTVPTIVAYGTNTMEDRKRGAPWLVAQLPDAGLFVIEGAGHWGHRTHPAGFAGFVRAVVESIPTAASPRPRDLPRTAKSP